MERPPNVGEQAELVYDLRQADSTSVRFYVDIATFSDRLLLEIDSRACKLIDAYVSFEQKQLAESPRSRGEYSLDFLTLGMTLAQYSGPAESAYPWVIALARGLFRLRSEYRWIKWPADLLRAPLTRLFLMPRIGRAASSSNFALEHLPHLIAWLQATGEYQREAGRIENWRRFLSSLPPAQVDQALRAAVHLFEWFKSESNLALGGYTQGVEGFLSGAYARRGCREDQIFCGRKPVEYHLNMVAAEIMNRGLREGFERTPNRVVLVPTCMRDSNAGGCRARASQMGLVCTACNPACTVNQTTQKMRSLGANVYLIPHATGFSRWLEHWEHNPRYGVVAAACLLNILPGGLEMRARGIASQCVPLDFPGCRKHWSAKGIPTALNQNRLVQLVLGGEHRQSL